MKLIILSPNIHLIFSHEQKQKLEKVFDVLWFSESQKLDDVLELQSHEEKIVAIDPDFCDWKITRENLEKMKGIKAICLQTTAFHYIDTDYLKEKNIPVTNLRGFSTNAVAEQAFAMTFALARKIPIVLREGCAINFERYRGMELRGRNIGIIGLGRIGTRIAEIAGGVGMNVSYWSRNSRNNHFQYKNLPDLLQSSDVLVYALATNEETKNILTDELLGSMKTTTLFVSIAHIDHTKFIQLAEKGKIAGYACDDKVGELAQFSGNILPGAELGWCTDECFRRNGEQWIEAILNANIGKFPNRVNL